MPLFTCFSCSALVGCFDLADRRLRGAEDVEIALGMLRVLEQKGRRVHG